MGYGALPFLLESRYSMKGPLLPLGLDEDWVKALLPDEKLLDPGPPPTYAWDISQTISELAYLTHGYYRYYGKFPPTIARKLLRVFRPTKGQCVLDNFCGGGTTLVEAKCEGIPAIGIDISPLAILASRVKSTVVNTVEVRDTLSVLAKRFREKLTVQFEDHSKLLPDSRVLQKWFDEDIAGELLALKLALMELPESVEREFLVLAFFAIIRRVSLAYDGEVRPHINKDKRKKDVWVTYERHLKHMLDRMQQFSLECDSEVDVVAICGDSRQTDRIVQSRGTPVGLIISHPPYLNCFDYAPVFKLQYSWMTGFTYEFESGVDYEHVRTNEVRAWPATNEAVSTGYMNSLQETYQSAYNILEPGGRCCVVLGDCTIKGELVPVLDVFTNIMLEIGFELDRTYLRTTHYGTGKYAYASRADYHGKAASKRDGILVFSKE